MKNCVFSYEVFHPHRRSRWEIAALCGISASSCLSFANLCEKEGYFAYINLSSGSELSANAGTLASLMYGAVSYYVQAEKYNIEHPDIEGVPAANC